MGDRRRFREDSEPSEGIDALEGLDRRWIHARPADAMGAVATGDEIASDLVAHAILLVAYARTIGVEIVRLDVGRLIDRRQARGFARVHQVEGNFGLAVDHHRLAGGSLHVDPMPRAAESQLDALMDQALAVGACARAYFIEQRDGALFEQPGADAAEHILRRLALDDDIVDSVSLEQLP